MNDDRCTGETLPPGALSAAEVLAALEGATRDLRKTAQAARALAETVRAGADRVRTLAEDVARHIASAGAAPEGPRTNMALPSDVVRRARADLEAHGITRTELAIEMGVPLPQVSRWFNHTAEPRVATALRIEAAVWALCQRRAPRGAAEVRE